MTTSPNDSTADAIVIGCDPDCDTAMNRFKEAPSASQHRAVKQGRLIALNQAVLSSVGEPMLDVAEQLTKRLWNVADSPAKTATPAGATP